MNQDDDDRLTEEDGTTRGGLLRRLERAGLGPRKERALNVALVMVVALFAGGWSVVITQSIRSGEPLNVSGPLTANPLAPDAPPPAAYVLDRLVRRVAVEPGWRGHSGALRAIITQPGDTLVLADTLGLDSLPAGARLEVQQADSPAVRASPEALDDRPGVWNVLLRASDEMRRLTDLAVLTPISAGNVQGGRIGRYLVGEWPSRPRSGKLATPKYDPPAGLIAVTPRTVNVPVSDHLVLGDFLTKGQDDVWPKYVVVSPELLDKLELTFQELERMGHPVEDVGVISGFRTPNYNVSGGDPSGRGSYSRHMYGDAMDLYIDNDGDGAMDDLNGDGRIDIGDARVIARAAERVEQNYPQYVGGIGTYRPNPGAHSGFVHIDTRGYRARW